MSSAEEDPSESQELMLNPHSSCNQLSPRKRGAPRGNKNALKHGFYARSFTNQEIADIADRKPLSVTDEINLVRIYMRRLIANFDSTSATQQDLLDTFRALCLGNLTLARLIRLHLLPAMLSQGSDSLSEMLKQVIGEVQQQNKQQTDDQPDNFLNPTTE